MKKKIKKNVSELSEKQAGRALAALHVGYETVPPCPGVEISGAEHDFFRVEKMRYVLDLLLSVINLSVQTVEIVERLPKVRFEG